MNKIVYLIFLLLFCFKSYGQSVRVCNNFVLSVDNDLSDGNVIGAYLILVHNKKDTDIIPVFYLPGELYVEKEEYKEKIYSDSNVQITLSLNYDFIKSSKMYGHTYTIPLSVKYLSCDYIILLITNNHKKRFYRNGTENYKSSLIGPDFTIVERVRNRTFYQKAFAQSTGGNAKNE